MRSATLKVSPTRYSPSRRARPRGGRGRRAILARAALGGLVAAGAEAQPGVGAGVGGGDAAELGQRPGRRALRSARRSARGRCPARGRRAGASAGPSSSSKKSSSSSARRRSLGVGRVERRLGVALLERGDDRGRVADRAGRRSQHREGVLAPRVSQRATGMWHAGERARGGRARRPCRSSAQRAFSL